MISCCALRVASGSVWVIKRMPSGMNNEKLNSIFNAVHKNYYPRRIRRVKAEFYPYRSLRHSVEWNGLRIKARISGLLREAPEHIIESVAIILLARVYRQKVTREIRSLYREYAGQLEISRPTRNISYDPDGEYYDLTRIFKRINERYFDNSIEISLLGWSRNRSYSRLGFYDKRRNLIVISRIFDSRSVPENIIEYLMYHEMLHIQIPEITVNGRRQVHSREFRESEDQFPEIDDIRKWLKKNVSRL